MNIYGVKGRTVLRRIFFPSHWLLFHMTVVETMNTGERLLNPVAMTIINPRKKILAGPEIEPMTSCSQALNYATS